jgi:peptidoglycan/LPS O-acetylase OafA/YrhL
LPNKPPAPRVSAGANALARNMASEGISTEVTPPDGEAALSANRIAALDYARFFAAMMVLAYHWTYSGISLGRVTSIELIEPVAAVSRFGLLGVDLFFLISGYVIFYSAQGRTAGRFAAARVVRLYPLFWVCLILTTLVCNTLGARAYHVSWQALLANLTMLAPVFGYRHADWVYWTLVLELSFYAAVTLLLLLRLGGRLGAVISVWPFVMLGASAAGLGHLPLLGGYYFLFAAGALFAHLRESKRAWLSVPLIVCVVMSIRRVAQRWPVFDDGQVSVAGLVGVTLMSAFFLFFLALNTPAVRKLRLPMSRILGAVSYPTYLLHAVIGYIVLQHVATDANKVAVWIIMLATVLAASWALHHLVERRMGPLWRRLGASTVGRGVEFLESVVHRQRSAPSGRTKISGQ